MMKLGTGISRSTAQKPISHFDVGCTRITHKANWDHIALVLATKEKLRLTPLPDEV